MRNFVILLLVALFAIAILLFVYNPDVLEKVWLWIVGLIGVIISAIRNLINSIKNFFKSDEVDEKAKVKQDQPENEGKQEVPVVQIVDAQSKGALEKKTQEVYELKKKIVELEKALSWNGRFDDYTGTTLTVLRYFNDGETTLGLLFLESKFFCYTLEDAPRDVKVKGRTRIPADDYTLAFNEQETPLTERYRESRSWFKYHLHVKNVPNFSTIYIHVGNTIKDTEGCLLVADSINSSDAKRSIYNSRTTFKKLYLTLKPIIEQGDKVRIKYYDEDWFEKFNLKRIKRIVA